MALIGFQGRGRDDVVQPNFCHDLFPKGFFCTKGSGQNDVHAQHDMSTIWPATLTATNLAGYSDANATDVKHLLDIEHGGFVVLHVNFVGPLAHGIAVIPCLGSVSKVEMTTSINLIYKGLFSIYIHV